MAAASKTLMEMMRPTKRIRSASMDGLTPKYSISAVSVSGAGASSGGDASPESPEVATTLEQKRRMEFNKAIARSKRNLKLCADQIEKAKGTGSRYVKLEELLVEDSWLKVLPGELKKPYAQSLCKFVEQEMRGSVPIYPPPQLIFNALHSTPFDQVKAVIIGQDPYHGPGQAMGLSFSVPEGIKIPSSLVNIFKELESDVGCKIPSHGNLERWAIQGVLLLNTVLTVRHHQANSHAKKGWEQFTDAVIQAISREKSGVVFLLWGNSAQAKTRLIDGSKHHILRAAHPSGLSANRGFFECKHFSQTNEILDKQGYTLIDWQL
ncbi:Uracil-DNA glycosylase [Rhynchospora pubera]|uniref:Uracil-DNA glycosylase n=1 Tax=Rhynchospora pubera TaxID=906938 RepID=A0AAV8BNT1_9POAL|nr:Uracil-DNA glycosylase [Rhynchospora pubera]